jgi:hypothetical protein
MCEVVQWREWPCLAYGEGENGCAFEPWVHQRARLKGSPSQSKAIPGRGTRRSFDVVFFSSEGSQRNPKCWQKFSAGLGWAGKFAAATKAVHLYARSGRLATEAMIRLLSRQDP